MVQRALDVNYLPASLLVDGQVDGRLEDYWAIVRASSRSLAGAFGELEVTALR